MKLYLHRNQRLRGFGDFPIHGKDYTKGTENKECGIPHEFRTRGCKPVFFTQEDVDASGSPDDYVEIVPFHGGMEITEFELSMKSQEFSYA